MGFLDKIGLKNSDGTKIDWDSKFYKLSDNIEDRFNSITGNAWASVQNTWDSNFRNPNISDYGQYNWNDDASLDKTNIGNVKWKHLSNIEAYDNYKESLSSGYKNQTKDKPKSLPFTEWNKDVKKNPVHELSNRDQAPQWGDVAGLNRVNAETKAIEEGNKLNPIYYRKNYVEPGYADTGNEYWVGLNLPDYGYDIWLNERTMFQKGIHNFFDEPGYFYFKLFFKFDTQYGLFGGVLNNAKHDVASNSATQFLSSMRGNAKAQYNQRIEALVKFSQILSYLNCNCPWFFRAINGLDKANVPTVSEFSKEKTIDIECNQDATDMRLNTLMDLYKFLVYDDAYGREVLPDNMRKFNLLVMLFQAPVRKIHSAIKINDIPYGMPGYTDNSLSNMMGFKLFEFIGCEFDLSTLGVMVPSSINIESPQPIGKGTIRIKYDRCVTHLGNEFSNLLFGSDGFYDNKDFSINFAQRVEAFKIQNGSTTRNDDSKGTIKSDSGTFVDLGELFTRNNLAEMSGFALGNIYGEEYVSKKYTKTMQINDNKDWSDTAKVQVLKILDFAEARQKFGRFAELLRAPKTREDMSSWFNSDSDYEIAYENLSRFNTTKPYKPTGNNGIWDKEFSLYTYYNQNLFNILYDNLSNNGGIFNDTETYINNFGTKTSFKYGNYLNQLFKSKKVHNIYEGVLGNQISMGVTDPYTPTVNNGILYKVINPWTYYKASTYKLYNNTNASWNYKSNLNYNYLNKYNNTNEFTWEKYQKSLLGYTKNGLEDDYNDPILGFTQHNIYTQKPYNNAKYNVLGPENGYNKYFSTYSYYNQIVNPIINGNELTGEYGYNTYDDYARYNGEGDFYRRGQFQSKNWYIYQAQLFGKNRNNHNYTTAPHRYNYNIIGKSDLTNLRQTSPIISNINNIYNIKYKYTTIPYNPRVGTHTFTVNINTYSYLNMLYAFQKDPNAYNDNRGIVGRNKRSYNWVQYQTNMFSATRDYNNRQFSFKPEPANNHIVSKKYSSLLYSGENSTATDIKWSDIQNGLFSVSRNHEFTVMPNNEYKLFKKTFSINNVQYRWADYQTSIFSSTRDHDITVKPNTDYDLYKKSFKINDNEYKWADYQTSIFSSTRPHDITVMPNANEQILTKKYYTVSADGIVSKISWVEYQKELLSSNRKHVITVIPNADYNLYNKEFVINNEIYKWSNYQADLLSSDREHDITVKPNTEYNLYNKEFIINNEIYKWADYQTSIFSSIREHDITVKPNDKEQIITKNYHATVNGQDVWINWVNYQDKFIGTSIKHNYTVKPNTNEQILTKRYYNIINGYNSYIMWLDYQQKLLGKNIRHTYTIKPNNKNQIMTKRYYTQQGDSEIYIIWATHQNELLSANRSHTYTAQPNVNSQILTKQYSTKTYLNNFDMGNQLYFRWVDYQNELLSSNRNHEYTAQPNTDDQILNKEYPTTTYTNGNTGDNTFKWVDYQNELLSSDRNHNYTEQPKTNYNLFSKTFSLLSENYDGIISENSEIAWAEYQTNILSSAREHNMTRQPEENYNTFMKNASWLRLMNYLTSQFTHKTTTKPYKPYNLLTNYLNNKS